MQAPVIWGMLTRLPPPDQTNLAWGGPRVGLPPRTGLSTEAFSLWWVSGCSETLFQAGFPRKEVLPGLAL